MADIAAIEAQGWKVFMQSLVPASQLKYNRIVLDFINFCSDNKDISMSKDSSMLTYIEHLHTDEKFAASTLWSMVSIINSFFMKALKMQSPFTTENLPLLPSSKKQIT